MNKLVLTKVNGGKVLALVLEPANLHRLQKGDPISLHIDDMFPDGIPKRLDLLLTYSETPLQDAKEFAKYTTMSFDERTPISQKMFPHCSQCQSTVEQFGVMTNESPFVVIYCSLCGAIWNVLPADLLHLNEKKDV